jgi:hypothetical protein
MPKRIPIAEAKRVAEAQNCRQVVLLAWDGELVHIVTYGQTKEDCADAARSGKALNQWLASKSPVSLTMFPSDG